MTDTHIHIMKVPLRHYAVVVVKFVKKQKKIFSVKFLPDQARSNSSYKIFMKLKLLVLGSYLTTNSGLHKHEVMYKDGYNYREQHLILMKEALIGSGDDNLLDMKITSTTLTDVLWKFVEIIILFCYYVITEFSTLFIEYQDVLAQ